MPKIEKITFGKLISAHNINNDEPYNDWRAEYIDRPGIIIIYESLRTRPGEKLIKLCLKTGNAESAIPYLQTSWGKVITVRDRITIVTEHSQYVFVEDDSELDEEDKMMLVLNTLG